MYDPYGWPNHSTYIKYWSTKTVYFTKVIVMENGRIVAQGTPSHVASVWPDLSQSGQKHASAEAGLCSEELSGTSSESQAKNHWNKLRLVTKSGYLFTKSGHHSREASRSVRRDSNAEVGNNQRWKRRSSRMNSLSLHMSHDLPLLMDELIAEQFEPAPTSPSGRQRARSISVRSNFVRISRHLSSLTTSVTADEPLTNQWRLRGSKEHDLSVRLSLQPVISQNPSAMFSGQLSPDSPQTDTDIGGSARKFSSGSDTVCK